MKGSVVQTLIWKDWDRHRRQIGLCIAAGIVAIGLVQIGGPILGMLGTTWFFVSLVVFGSMLPVSNVVNERKKQTLAFLMSLPISAAQYAVAKLVSTVGMFLVSWLALVIAAMSFIVGRQDIPNGLIPAILILAILTFVGFCIIAGVALVTESEGWTIAATVATNSSYGFGWYLFIRNPVLRASMGNGAAVWSAPILTILAVEIAAIAVILALTIYVQSRKRDFV
jgi:ABC-type Na+ efflux pump permease subunit